MGRPRKDQAGASARKRLADAFWELLDEFSLSEITISLLSRRAGVNHNTFYYHFSNIEDMARTLFMENLDPRLLLSITPVEPHLENEEDIGYRRLSLGEAPEDLIQHFRRTLAFARDRSPFAQRLLREQMLEAWLSVSGRVRESLSQQEILNLQFLLGGICALASRPSSENVRSELEEFVSGPLGSFVFSWLAEFVKKPQGDAL